MNSDKPALVTGGNRGMGLEICRELAAIWLATSPDAQHSGGYYRKRELIDW